MGRAANTDFSVVDTITVDVLPEWENIKDSSVANNYLVQSALKNIDIAKFQHKEINAQRMPSINVTSGYTFTQNNSKAGLQLFNRSYGPTFGLNAIIPIFNGGMVKKQLEASAVNIASQEVQLAQVKNNLDAQVLSAYQNFDYAKKVLQLNEETVQAARENVEITLERFRLNESNSLDIRTAQSSLEDALYNVILARYNAKIAEIELKKLSNKLVH